MRYCSINFTFPTRWPKVCLFILWDSAVSDRAIVIVTKIELLLLLVASISHEGLILQVSASH